MDNLYFYARSIMPRAGGDHPSSILPLKGHGCSPRRVAALRWGCRTDDLHGRVRVRSSTGRRSQEGEKGGGGVGALTDDTLHGEEQRWRGELRAVEKKLETMGKPGTHGARRRRVELLAAP
jgi:hypothetical protein